MESLVGMVGRLCVGIAVFRDGDMSKWWYVGMAACRNGGMSEWQHGRAFKSYRLTVINR